MRVSRLLYEQIREERGEGETFGEVIARWRKYAVAGVMIHGDLGSQILEALAPMDEVVQQEGGKEVH